MQMTQSAVSFDRKAMMAVGLDQQGPEASGCAWPVTELASAVFSRQDCRRLYMVSLVVLRAQRAILPMPLPPPPPPSNPSQSRTIKTSRRVLPNRFHSTWYIRPSIPHSTGVIGVGKGTMQYTRYLGRLRPCILLMQSVDPSLYPPVRLAC